MLKLSTLHTYLNQVLDLPDLHTAILLTPTGQLISYASDPSRSKEDVRSVVGLSGDSFLEVEEQGFATFEIKGKPHLGSIYVLAVNEAQDETQDGWQPLMLLALNFSNGYDQEVVRLKHGILAHNLKTTVPPRTTAVIKTAELLNTPRPNPFVLLASELDYLRGNLLRLLGSAHPTLHHLAHHYFANPSKQIRPLVVLLLSRATNGLGNEWEQKKWIADCERVSGRHEELDRTLTRPGVLNDCNSNMSDDAASFQSFFSLQTPRTLPEDPPLPSSYKINHNPALVDPPTILPAQIRLAQLVEMIHVASSLHDQVVNETSSPSDGTGNKLAILGGDFLLGRASTALSRLGDDEVVELVATVIANIVEGAVWKAGNVGTREILALASPAQGWSRYLNRIYLGSASLLAKAGRAAVILGGSKEGELWKEIAYIYGLHIGFANQLMKDVDAYEEDNNNFDAGLTGPLLYAWEDHSHLKPIIQRQFSEDGDVEQVRHAVRSSSGSGRTRKLALTHSEKAREILRFLPDSDTKDALEELTLRVVHRTDMIDT
ncbi:isoprenoid synthase domain-containing protein [Lentinula aff. lateritia]|uniref:Isoprenoid synthase domain-containing protein n=1 Tax=Lentinula aff. lateritia TaxID=2804960 RepID=A0ACC1UFN2_9AGAR|nr:isoprenoid synthase domain-containing protein [Lentinula aff. lateritia]